MGAAAYVGRVGGLAVALGLGAAVATGHGVASASPGSESSSPKSSEQSSSGASSETGTDAGSGAVGAKVSPGAKDDSGDATPESSRAASPAQTGPVRTRSTTRDALRSAEPGQARGSGGLITTAESEKSEVVLTEDVLKEDDAEEVVDVDEIQDAVEPGDTEEAYRPTRLPAPSVEAPTDEEARSKRSSDRSHSARVLERLSGAALSRIAVPTPNEVETVEVAPEALKKLVDRADGVDEDGLDPVGPDAFELPMVSDSTIEAEDPAIMMAAASAPETPPARGTVTGVVAGFLSAIGFGPLVSSTPVAPAAPPALWALLAAARREVDRAVSSFTRILNVGNAGPVATAQINPAAAAVTPNAATITNLTGQTREVGWVTGPASPNNTLVNFNIHGTDLGIMWDNGLEGDQRQVLIAFGDTFSQPGMVGDWRNNVLFRSADRLLSNGLAVPAGSVTNIFSGSPLSDPGRSKQLIFGIPGTIGLLGIPSFFGSEVTMIPTAGIAVPYDNELGARQYINVMSVRQWGPAGMWTTNYSAIAFSDDNGQNWTIDQSTIRSSGWLRTWGHSFTPGNDNFQQGAFVHGVTLDGETGEAVSDGYVYSYGTPAGRFGPAYVSRVAEDQVQNLGAYQYWNGSRWVTGNPSAAAPIFGGPTGFFAPVINFFEQFGLVSFANNMLGLFGIPVIIPRGDVSELSVQYNEYLGKYVAVYTNSSGVVMRTSDTPQGPWGDPITLATPGQYPGLYAPMIHPWSGTDQIDDADNFLYWNMSMWNPYNVVLMETDLSQLNL